MATTNAQTFTIGGVTHQVEDTTARAGVASLQSALASLQSALDTLMGTEDVTDEIDTYNEIKDFLDGFDVDDPTLSSQLTLLNTAINDLTTALQDKVNTSALQTAVSNLQAAINGKVTAENGKGLSTNDYTNEDKAAVATIANKANSADVYPKSQTYDKDEVDGLIDDKLTDVTVNAVGNSATMYFAGSALCIASANIIQVTATPTITYVDNEQNVVVSVSGNGTLKAYLDDVEQTLVSGSFTILKERDAKTVVVTATAKEEGKAISAEASLTIQVGSYVDTSKYMTGYSPQSATLESVKILGTDYPVVFDGTTTTVDSTTYKNWYVDLASWLNDGESTHVLASAASTSTGIFGTSATVDTNAVKAITQIPEGVTSIGAYAFINLGTTSSAVSKVVLPSTITSVGTRAFRSSNISLFHFKGENAPSFESSVSNTCFGSMKPSTINIEVESATAKSNYEGSTSLATAVTNAEKTLSVTVEQ